MSIPEPIVEFKFGDETIDTWQSFRVVHDLLSPADEFDMTFGAPPWDPRLQPEPIVERLRAHARAFSRVELHVDGALQLTGYLDTISGGEGVDGPEIRVTGRDVGGQVVDEGMPPSWNIVGMTLREVLEKVLEKWDIEVVIGNEGNRRLITTKKKKYKWKEGDAAPADGQDWYKKLDAPPEKIPLAYVIQAQDADGDGIPDEGSGGLGVDMWYIAYDTVIAQRKLHRELKCEPDDSRWDWIQRLLKTQNLMGWFSVDGKFIVATPNYVQAPMFRAVNVETVRGIREPVRFTRDDNNIEDGDSVEKPGERYSVVYVLGRQGKDPIRAEAHDAELEALGVDRPFYHIDNEIRSIEEAQWVADRKLEESLIRNTSYTYTMTGFGQGDRLFAFDTVWDVWDDAPTRYVHGSLYCTNLVQRYDKETGPMTVVRLQPLGIIPPPNSGGASAFESSGSGPAADV